MTYGEIKRKVLEKIDRATINGAAIPASYNGQSDALQRIPGLINEAVMAICTEQHRYTGYFAPKAEEGTPFGKLIRYPLPENFYSLQGGSVFRMKGRDAQSYTRARIVGREIILPPGDFLVEYWRYPDLLPDDPADTYDYRMALEILHAAMCFAAARLVVTEDESLYNALMRDYRAWLEALDVPFWTETTKVADVYGGRE